MRPLFTFLCFLALIACSNEGSDLNDKTILTLIGDFKSQDWEKVYHAKDTLESLEEKSLPYLFSLLDQESDYVKLVNTADLIYPGASEYYGHGWVIDYDLDWLAIRAGWAIEEITFQNFGFKESKITEENLFKLEMDTVKYKEYTMTGKYKFKIEQESKNKLAKTIRKTNEWWASSQESWTRRNAIKDAIESNDTIRELNGLSHLRSGNCINGLDFDYFKKSIEPGVTRLLESSSKDVREQARLLIEDVSDNGEFHYVNFTTRCLKPTGRN